MRAIAGTTAWWLAKAAFKVVDGINAVLKHVPWRWSR